MKATGEPAFHKCRWPIKKKCRSIITRCSILDLRALLGGTVYKVPGVHKQFGVVDV